VYIHGQYTLRWFPCLYLFHTQVRTALQIERSFENPLQ
jgi:hypothetical protein